MSLCGLRLGNLGTSNFSSMVKSTPVLGGFG
jgi:hypothetical protein